MCPQLMMEVVSGKVDDSSKVNDISFDESRKTIKKELVINRNSAIVGGFLDLAIFTADVEHLKFIVEAGRDKLKYYDLLLGCLIASLSLQIFTAVLLCFSGYLCQAKNKCDPVCQARRRQLLTNFTMAVVVVISVLSVIKTTFGSR